MKPTGITRKIDNLGRIVVPKEIRKTLDMDIGTSIEIYLDDESIILKKYKANMACQITGEVSNDNMVLANGKIVLSQEGAKLLINELKKTTL